jgi:pantoate--beta-alanine ligase
MLVVETKKEISELTAKLIKEGKTVGFVPTMGALHLGHTSLVTKSVKENDYTIVSIFVNPTQFNDKNDLVNYPRTLDKDLKMLSDAGCDFVFYPSVNEMYPEPDTRVFEFDNIGNVMEGKHRPGHFNGVAQIVSKLFEAVPANNAYFGDKDFQQLAIIKQLVRKYNIAINIIPCPIVREPDGLAMSSRNMLLTPEQRKNAVVISQTLFKAKQLVDEKKVDELKQWVIEQVNANPFLEVEYFEIVDDTELKTIVNWNEPVNKIGCIAVKVGKIRLIDNIRF